MSEQGAKTKRKYPKRVPGLKMPCTICKKEVDESRYYYNANRHTYDSHCLDCKAQDNRDYIERIKESRKPSKKNIQYVQKEVEPDFISIEETKKYFSIGSKFTITNCFRTYRVRRNYIVTDVLQYGVLARDQNGFNQSFTWFDLLQVLKERKKRDEKRSEKTSEQNRMESEECD